MGDIKSLLVGMAIFGFFAIVIVAFMAGNYSKYGVDSYNSSKFNSFNKLTEVNQISENIKLESEKTSSSSVVDVFLAYFKMGWNWLKLTVKSIGIATSMVDEGVDSNIVGFSGDGLKILLYTLIIFLVIGTLMYVLLGREW